MGAPIDINLPPDQLKASISQALNNTTEYGVFQPNPRYPNRRVWTGEMEVQIGDSVSLKWDPKLREGYIDVEGAPGKNMKDLFSDFDKAREGLPKGRFLLSPAEAKDAQGNVITRKALKHKLYKRKFKNDSQVTLNEDLGLRNRPGGSIESFTLDTTKGTNMSTPKSRVKLNDIQAKTGVTITPDADGFYDISSSSKPQLQQQIWDRIKGNPKGFTKAGLNLKIKIDGVEKLFRNHGDKTKQTSWTFDDKAQNLGSGTKRTIKVREGTLTKTEYQDQAEKYFTELGKKKINYLGKEYTAKQYGNLKFKQYKSNLTAAKRNPANLVLGQRQALGIWGPASAGHIKPPGHKLMIESDLNYMAEQSKGRFGNFANQAKTRPNIVYEALGLNQTREQFIQNDLRGTQRRFSDAQKNAAMTQGVGLLSGSGVTHRIRIPKKSKVNRQRSRLAIPTPSTRDDSAGFMDTPYGYGIDMGSDTFYPDPLGLLGGAPPLGKV